jgi:hypothetical protein
MKRSRFSEEQIIGILKEARGWDDPSDLRQGQRQRADLLRLETKIRGDGSR